MWPLFNTLLCSIPRVLVGPGQEIGCLFVQIRKLVLLIKYGVELFLSEWHFEVSRPSWSQTPTLEKLQGLTSRGHSGGCSALVPSQGRGLLFHTQLVLCQTQWSPLRTTTAAPSLMERGLPCSAAEGIGRERKLHSRQQSWGLGEEEAWGREHPGETLPRARVRHSEDRSGREGGGEERPRGCLRGRKALTPSGTLPEHLLCTWPFSEFSERNSERDTRGFLPSRGLHCAV